MASTFSDRLKLELMATGANANTWGTNTNNNLDVIDAFAAGYLSKSVAGSANITLTTANASDTAEASNKVIELTGALTGDIVVFIPAVESNYTFFNNTTGSQTLTIAATGHTANGTQITQGAHTTVYCDGSSDFNVEIASSTDAAALNKGTLPDGRFPATLPAISGANLTNLDADDLASGTVPDARFPATLPQVSGANLTNLNASNVASGTVASDRLPTVPTTKGGTGLTSIGSAGEVLKVNSGGSALEFGDAGGGGNYIRRIYTNPATWSYDSSIQAIKVTVVGGGGSGGTGSGPGSRAGHGQPGGYSDEYISAPALSNPISVTVGGTASTSSFGSCLSATGGNPGNPAPAGNPGNPGSGSGGDQNFANFIGARVDSSMVAFGYGSVGGCNSSMDCQLGCPGCGYGGGALGGRGQNFPAFPGAGGTGASGVVIVEEFY